MLILKVVTCYKLTMILALQSVPTVQLPSVQYRDFGEMYRSSLSKLTGLRLQGLCHNDIAVLGQLNSWYLYPYTKCCCKVMKKISNKFHQGVQTILLFSVNFAGIA